MIYQSNTIKSTISGSTVVAAAAGIASADWASHVFVRYGEVDSTGNTNVGRMPVVIIRESSVDYAFEAEPDHQGTRTSQFVVRVIVPSFLVRSETQWKLLDRIRTAIIAVLTQKLELGPTDVSTATPVISNVSISQDITFTTESSYDKNISEGN